MRSFITALIALPLAVVVVALAVSNNQPVTISFDPFSPAQPLLAVTVPLYFVFFAALAAGVLAGGLGAWFGQGRFRRAARENRREAVEWRQRAETLESRDAAAAPAPGLPAVSARSGSRTLLAGQ